MRETVICNQAHVCKKEPCHHKIPHEHNCANPAPCADFLFTAGKTPDKCIVPVSVCVTVSTDGHYHISRREWCNCCGGRGYTDHLESHKAV